jgi:Secretion system C-terminal sorting domain
LSSIDPFSCLLITHYSHYFLKTKEDVTHPFTHQKSFLSMTFILQTTRKISFSAFIFSICLFSVQTAFSQRTWDGGAGSMDKAWSTASNWSGDAVPTATDDVTIIEGADVIVTTAATAVCRKLIVNGSTSGGQGKVTINAMATLNVDASAITSVANDAALVLFGGMIDNKGTMTVTGKQNLDAIRFDNPTSGTTLSSTYMGAGGLTCTTTAAVGLGPASGGNNGTAITFAQTSGDTARFILSSTMPASSFVLNTGGSKSVFYCPKGKAKIEGTGTITINGGVRSIRVIPGANSDAPNFTIESGVIMDLTSTVTTTTVGMVLIDAGILTGTTVNMTNKGTLNFSGNACHPIYLNNQFTTTPTATTAPSTTNFTNEGTININGTFADASMTGGINMAGANTTYGNVLTNSGTINYNTLSGGTSTKPALIASISPKNVINNSGTITIGTNGSLTNAIRLGNANTTMNNTGTVTVGTGSISGNSSNATFNNNAGGIVNYNSTANANSTLVIFTNTGGTFNANVSVRVGRFAINNGTVTIADGTTFTTFLLTLTFGNITLGTGKIVIESGGSASGSATSYVVTNGTGVLSIEGFTGSKTFPVGTTGAYAPVIVNNSATSRHFSVKVGSAFSGTPAAATKMVQLQWDITPSDLTANNAALTLQWPATAHGSAFNPALATEIAHYTGTWNEFKLATVSGSDPYTAMATGFTSFSPFAVANQNALSVELTNFKATPLSKINVLTWETASEINNKGFDVQRKTATGAWETLGFVNGTGKASTYTFEDKTPLSISYYRLRQVDFDGKETLSKVVSVSQDTKGRISITPNPTSDKVNILLNQNDVSNQTATIVLSDMTGRQVLTQKTTASVVELDLSNLAKGMYVMTVQSNNAIYQEKIIRQ